jgi:hypothetical protein
MRCRMSKSRSSGGGKRSGGKRSGGARRRKMAVSTIRRIAAPKPYSVRGSSMGSVVRPIDGRLFMQPERPIPPIPIGFTPGLLR